jgi:hypothetical protein
MARKAKESNGTPVAGDATAWQDLMDGEGSRLIPVDKIRPSPLNPRKHFDEAALAELAASIKAKGVLQPILVRPMRWAEALPLHELDCGGIKATKRMAEALEDRGIVSVQDLMSRLDQEGGARTLALEKLGGFDRVFATQVAEAIYAFEEVTKGRLGYELADGERRWRAAQLAGLRVVPAIVRELSDQDLRVIALITLEQRADISPIEKAEAYQAAAAAEGVEALARRVGKSVSTIRGFLLLCRLPEKLKEAVAENHVPVSTAQLVARVPTEFLRERVGLAVLGGGVWYEVEKFFSPATADPEKLLSRAGDRVLSFRDTKELIERHCTVELKGAKFDRTALNLVEAAGDCEQCPKRVGNLAKADPEGFEGIRADVCTDPQCFRAKTEAHQANLRAQAEASGKQILTGKEAKELFPYGGHLKSDAPYVELEGRCAADPKRRPYRKLVGKQLADRVVVAEDKDGNLHNLLPRAEVAKLLKEQGLTIGKGSASGLTEHDRQERAKRLAENRLRRETDRAILARAFEAGQEMFAALSDDGGEPAMAVVLRSLADLLTSGGYGSVLEEMVGRRGIKAPRAGDQREAIENLIQAGGCQSLMGLMVEYCAGRRTMGYSAADRSGLAGALGIDKAAIERQVKAGLKEKAAAKKAGKATSRERRPAAVAAGDDQGEEEGEQRCRVCGCTEQDCRQCIEKTGQPCSWVEGEPDLCTACAEQEDAELGAAMNAEDRLSCSYCEGHSGTEATLATADAPDDLIPIGELTIGVQDMARDWNRPEGTSGRVNRHICLGCVDALEKEGWRVRPKPTRKRKEKVG